MPTQPRCAWFRRRDQSYTPLLDPDRKRQRKGHGCLWTAAAAVMVLAVAGWGLFTLIMRLTRVRSESKFVPLQFDGNGTFQISVFEDLHYGEAEDLDWGPEQDRKTTQVINQILDSEQPHLVVLNGDLITGENTMKENSTYYLDQIVAPLVSRSLPWASTYGNHDSHFNLSRTALLEREQQFENSLTQSMVDSPNSTAGVTNYYLEVFPAGNTTQPSLILWFFDSRGGNLYQKKDASGETIGSAGWVDETVAKWTQDTYANLTTTYRKKIPSLAFVHIPVNAFLAFQTQGVGKKTEPGINDDNPLSQQGITKKQDDNGDEYVYGGQDVPFMKALMDVGTLAVFSGHDHGDDWCFKWNTKLPGMNITGNGINMCFGRHTGHGGYGTWTRGSRQILVREDELEKKELETWIKLEDGRESGRVMLNETYGKDQYDPVEE